MIRLLNLAYPYFHYMIYHHVFWYLIVLPYSSLLLSGWPWVFHEFILSCSSSAQIPLLSCYVKAQDGWSCLQDRM